MKKGRHIITGAPSTGKSTVIKELSLTHETFPEVARIIIQQELALNSENVPWINNHEFSNLVVKQQIKDYQAQKNSLSFYDRGLPDVIAYLHYHKQEELTNQFILQAKKYKYSNKVFLLPPWEKIYQKDLERRESFKEAIKVHHQLIASYTNLKYEIIEVPFVSPKERVKFILDRINS